MTVLDTGLIAGTAAAAAAAVCFDGAVILQAAEARRVDDAHALRLSLVRRLVIRPRWLLGTAIGVLGLPLQLLALSLAPLTVVQPTLALGLVVLLVLGSRVLGERVGARELASAGVVIGGVVLLVAAAPEPTVEVPSAPAMALTALALVAIIAAPFVAGRVRAGAWLLVAGAGSAFALSALTSKLLTVELERGRSLAVLGLAVATAAAAGVGFLLDMSALVRFEATRVAPPMFVLETALPVALAPVLFGERWSATAGGGVLVVTGLLLVLAGGAALGAARSVAAGELEDQIGGTRQRAVGEVGPAG